MLLVAITVAYAVLRYPAVARVAPDVVRHHGVDVLAAPALLAIAGLLAGLSGLDNPFVRPIPAISLVGAATVEWELIAPLYTQATADWRDVIAYALGTMAYLTLLARARTTRTG